MWHCSQMFGIESLIDRERGGAGTRLWCGSIARQPMNKVCHRAFTIRLRERNGRSQQPRS